MKSDVSLDYLGHQSVGTRHLSAHKEREHDALLRLARDIIEAGERRRRPLSPEEDAIVTEFLK